jgi:hypothetical protein
MTRITDRAVRAHILGLSLLLGFGTVCFAQQSKNPMPEVSGVVTSADGRAVSHAEVGLLGLGVAVTDSAGLFGFLGVPAGTFFIRVQRLGFRPIMQAVTFDGVHPLSVTLRFEEKGVMLAPVVVHDSTSDAREPSGFTRRSQSGQGLFLTEGDIARRHAHRVEHLLASVPGLQVDTAGVVRVDRGRMSLYGDNCQLGVQILIDGVAVGADFSLRSMSVDALHGIEVYRGVASTPVELRSARTACGTVAIWTK